MPKSFCFDEDVASSRSQYCVIIAGTDNNSKQVESMDQMDDKQAQMRGQHSRDDDDDPQNNSTYCSKHPGCGDTENYICKGETNSRRHPATTNATSTTYPKWCVGCDDTRTVSARKYCCMHDQRHQCNIPECLHREKKARGDFCKRDDPRTNQHLHARKYKHRKYKIRDDLTNPRCIKYNCKNQVYARGFCLKHDPNFGKRCKEENCKNRARARGYCNSHDPSSNRGKCKEVNCNNLSESRGYCNSHDPNRKMCKEENCNNLSQNKGYCNSHDPNAKKCKEVNCNNLSQARGYCKSHDPNRKRCKEENCNNLSQAKGYCNSHNPN